MATNGIDMAATLVTKPVLDRAPEENPVEAGDFALAPLVDKIAHGIARGLIVAVKELEHHIAAETRKVGDSVDRRLDAFEVTLQDLSAFVAEQRSTNAALQDQLQQLAAADAALREADSRQAADLESLRKATSESDAALSQRIEVTVAELKETDARQATDLVALNERIDGLCKELGVQQEDIAALKSAVCAFSARMDALVERLDRQGDAVRSICTAYSQRETELEQLVDGLARLRAYPTPLPASAL